MNKKLLLVILTIFITVPFLPAKQTKLIAKYLQVSVSNVDGSFILYGRKKSEDEWFPLNFEDFPPTSYFRFFRGNKAVPFGRSSGSAYSETTIKDNKIQYYWHNKMGRIDIEYKLIKSAGSSFINTLVIDVNIQNSSDKPIIMDWYFCLDTWFGEKSRQHFYLPGNITVNNETEVPMAATVSYIRSYSPEKQMAVNILFGMENQILPDRIYFANWKRINETIDLYHIKEGRLFDLKPYSVNDSAVVVEFRDEEIFPNRDHIYRLVLSMESDIVIDTSSVTTTIPDTISTTTTTLPLDDSSSTTQYEEGSIDDLELINISLTDLLSLLDEINKRLKEGTLSQSDVDRSKEILEEIRRRTDK